VNRPKISEIRTRGLVREIVYHSVEKVLYIADGDFGLEIWDVSDIYNPCENK